MAVTNERIKERLNYDPATGIFTHAVTGGRAAVGSRADFSNGKRYRQVAVDRHCFSAHRVAWLLVHGEWPKGQIDHINGDIFDNRIENLRDVTPSQNQANRRNTKLGPRLRGVRIVGNRWKASIGKDNKYLHIGYYDTREQARAAYDAVSLKLFGEYSYVAGRAS
jgi:hypothetical protein